MGPNAVHSVHDIDRRHDRGIRPPEFPDDLVAGKPGVGLLEFVSHQQFGRIDPRVLDDQMLVRRDARNPGSASRELVVQHQFVGSETQTLSSTKRPMTAMNFLSITLCGTGVSGSETGGAAAGV